MINKGLFTSLREDWKTLKKFWLLEIFFIPAFFGFLFVPFLLILSQFGWANLENSLISKILVSFSALCMYLAYGFLIAHLRRNF